MSTVINKQKWEQVLTKKLKIFIIKNKISTDMFAFPPVFSPLAIPEKCEVWVCF